MFIINVRTEMPSTTPSLMQSLVDAFTTAFNTANLMLSLASPLNAVVAGWNMQRSLAKAWRMA